MICIVKMFPRSPRWKKALGAMPGRDGARVLFSGDGAAGGSGIRAELG